MRVCVYIYKITKCTFPPGYTCRVYVPTAFLRISHIIYLYMYIYYIITLFVRKSFPRRRRRVFFMADFLLMSTFPYYFYTRNARIAFSLYLSLPLSRSLILFPLTINLTSLPVSRFFVYIHLRVFFSYPRDRVAR